MKRSNSETLRSPTKQEALEFVDFPVSRRKVYMAGDVELGQQVEIKNKSVLVNERTQEPIAIVGKNYNFVPHKAAMESMIEAIENMGVEYAIRSVALDRNGAKLFMDVDIKKEYTITDGVTIAGRSGTGDILIPNLTGVNSYDGLSALGWELGSQRLVCLNLAKAKVTDLRARWMHLGNVADPAKLRKAAELALVAFDQKVVPMYQQLALKPVDEELAMRIVNMFSEKKILPAKTASFAAHCVKNGRDNEANLGRSLWTTFNAFTWATTKQEFSPIRRRDLEGRIAKAFADGGDTILEEAKAFAPFGTRE